EPTRLDRGAHVSAQHILDLQRLSRRDAAWPAAGGVGLERDDARAAVRAPAAALRTNRRRASALSREQLRALEGAQRRDGPPVQPLERCAICGLAALKYYGAGRLSALSQLLGRSPQAQ